jgi:large subunit ribosomal protein L29
MKQRKQYLQDLLDKSVKELVSVRKELQKNLFQLRMQNSMNGVKKTSDIKLFRKNIARVNTVLSHKIETLYGSSR